jgi:hypothetical protein
MRGHLTWVDGRQFWRVVVDRCSLQLCVAVTPILSVVLVSLPYSMVVEGTIFRPREPWSVAFEHV